MKGEARAGKANAFICFNACIFTITCSIYVLKNI